MPIQTNVLTNNKNSRNKNQINNTFQQLQMQLIYEKNNNNENTNV